MCVIGGMCYWISCGLTLGLPNLVALHGFEKVSIALAVIMMVLGLVAVPMAFWGKEVRQYGMWYNLGLSVGHVVANIDCDSEWSMEPVRRRCSAASAVSASHSTAVMYRVLRF